MKYNPDTGTVTGTTPTSTFTAAVEATRNGITITNLAITPTTPNKDINHTTIQQINLTEIRDTYRKQATHNAQPQTPSIKLKRKRRVNTPDFLYNCAQDVLEETTKGRGIRNRLADQWGVSVNTAKSRVRLMRSEGWLTGGHTKALPGPTYIRHKQTNQ